MHRILILAFLAATQYAFAEPVYLGEQALVARAWYSCQHRYDLQFLKSLNSKQWRVLAGGYAESHGCRLMEAGGSAVVANTLVWTGDTCLRLSPGERCYWFPEAYVMRNDSAVGAIK